MCEILVRLFCLCFCFAMTAGGFETLDSCDMSTIIIIGFWVI
jgi:hypothetical protein